MCDAPKDKPMDRLFFIKNLEKLLFETSCNEDAMKASENNKKEIRAVMRILRRIDSSVIPCIRYTRKLKTIEKKKVIQTRREPLNTSLFIHQMKA